MIKEVSIPAHVLKGILPLVRGASKTEDLKLFGADTESEHGLPMSVQIASADDDLFVYTNADHIFLDFWSWIMDRIWSGKPAFCYIHNLRFDTRILLSRELRKLYEQGGEFSFDIGNATVSGLYGKVNKVVIREGKKVLTILDSKAFTQASFPKSLKMFKVGIDKLVEPEGLGELRYDKLPKTDKRRIDFEKYAPVDARGAYGLGVKIVDIHRTYDVNPSVSLPAFASKVFRRHFLKPDESIDFPPDEVVKAAERSYHGGKNGFYLPGPSVLEDLYEIDINSAYPYGMSRLAPMTDGEFVRVEEFEPGADAIYCLSGRVEPKDANGRYPLVYDHGFKPVPPGPFANLWHSSYETELILKSRNVRVTRLWGFAWFPTKHADNPFKRFVDHFYEKKENTPKDDPYYYFYKICLNALYGKLVNTVEVRSRTESDELDRLKKMGVEIPDSMRVDERYDPVLKRYAVIRKEWRAGNLYNPFLASLITGRARAMLYDLETRTQAVHSATDSVKTRAYIEPRKGLGGYKIECFGRAYLFRNKLYLHYSKGTEFCHHERAPFTYPAKRQDGSPHPRAGRPLVDSDGQHLCKVGRHGYKGPLWVLHDSRHSLIESGSLRYQYTHVVGLREGLRRGLQPADFIPVDETLTLAARPGTADADADGESKEVAYAG